MGGIVRCHGEKAETKLQKYDNSLALKKQKMQQIKVSCSQPPMKFAIQFYYSIDECTHSTNRTQGRPFTD